MSSTGGPTARIAWRFGQNWRTVKVREPNRCGATMFDVMAEQNADAILNAVRAYLAVEFEGATITETEEARTRNIILHVRDVLGHRRLVVTQTYRDGDDNLDVAIGNLVRWNVAEMMRQASGSLVVLETTGARVARE